MNGVKCTLAFCRLCFSGNGKETMRILHYWWTSSLFCRIVYGGLLSSWRKLVFVWKEKGLSGGIFSLCSDIYVGMGREKMSQSKFPVFAVVALWKNAATNTVPSQSFSPKKNQCCDIIDRFTWKMDRFSFDITFIWRWFDFQYQQAQAMKVSNLYQFESIYGICRDYWLHALSSPELIQIEFQRPCHSK